MKPFLLIPKLKIQNANAMGSTYTVGFPAMTAWMGAVHALQRKLRKSGFTDIFLNRVAISCHECNMQLYKGASDRNYSIIGTANPLKKKGADFERPPFIEEARCHLIVSLLIELSQLNADNDVMFLDTIQQLLPQMKAAGGDIIQFGKAKIYRVDETDPHTSVKAMNSLMPGYVIIDRSDLLKAAHAEGEDALDELLKLLSVKLVADDSTDTDNAPQWKMQRHEAGWLVPLALGFQDISGQIQVQNQRSIEYEHHFAESLVTIGEFKMPFRFQNLEDMLWEYDFNPQQGLYLCRNKNQWNSEL